MMLAQAATHRKAVRRAIGKRVTAKIIFKSLWEVIQYEWVKQHDAIPLELTFLFIQGQAVPSHSMNDMGGTKHEMP
jgi:hypothetical protein